MGRKIDLDDLLEAPDVAELIGVANANVVGIYQARYDDFPAPVWASKGGRCKLWLRGEIVAWATSRRKS